jgi:hypothetical protein
MASFTPAFVASTSARRDSSVENSRRCSITVKKRCSKWLCNQILFLFLFSLLLLLRTCPGCA